MKDPFVPVISSSGINGQITPDLQGENTNAQVNVTGITYSDPGITYSDPGIAYGGVYNVDEDIIPLVSLAENIVPSIQAGIDLGNPKNIPSNNLPVGPGWFMYVMQ